MRLTSGSALTGAAIGALPVNMPKTSPNIDAAGFAGTHGAVHLSGATIGRRWTDARKAEILESRVKSTRLLAETLALLDPRPSVLVCAGGIRISSPRSP